MVAYLRKVVSNDTGCFKRRTFQDCFIEKDMMVVTATIMMVVGNNFMMIVCDSSLEKSSVKTPGVLNAALLKTDL